MTKTDTGAKVGLMERLRQGSVICAEGYLFECERRGYLQAGAFVPEVVVEHPEVIAELHREFVHAGSDIVEAFTYYGHREKLRLIGKEHLLEPLNRNALEIARQVAQETGTLVAGDLSNTNLFTDDPSSHKTVRAMFDEQLAWAVEAGADLLIGETFSYLGEARHRAADGGDHGLPPGAQHSRRVLCHRNRKAPGGRRRRRGRAQLRPRAAHYAAPPQGGAGGRNLQGGGPSGAVPDDARAADDAVASRPQHECAPVSHCARPVRLHPLRDGGLRPRGARAGRQLPGRLLRRRPAPHTQRRRGTRPHAAGEPLLPRHVEARLPGQRPDAQEREP